MTHIHVAGFVLRTPLLPVSDLLALADGLAAPRTGGEHLEGVLDGDRALVRRRLREMLRRAEVRDAIAVAAPALDAALERWAEQPLADGAAKIEAALFRYVARMAGRPTPFGLCAGCSTGRIGDGARLSIGATTELAPHSRLDMDVLLALVESLTADPDIREELVFTPNPGLYRAGGRLRYVEAVADGPRRACRLVAADPDPELLAALESARGGARPAQLASTLELEGAAAADARAYVDELIDSQLLVPDIALAVIGPEPTRPLAARLKAIPAARPIADLLERAADELEAADRAPAGERRARHRALAARLSDLPVAADPGRLFQVDLVRAAPDASLPLPVLAALRHGLEILRRLPAPPEPDDLRRLRERFTERYGDRVVPLAEALDPDVGVGLEATTETREASEGEREPHRSPDVEQMLLRLAGEAALRGDHEVQLGRRELGLLAEQPARPLPGAFAVMAALAAESDEALGRGEFQVRLISASGPSGARLLGRFCHADPQQRALVEAHLAREEELRPDAVFAEIVHLPEGRTGNVLARPRMREHELLLLGGSTAPANRRLLLDDLTLALEDGRFVLRSRRLQAEVVPRLTTAHNYLAGGIGLYRFLALLQEQEGGGLGWSWGAAAALPFTPRVRCGRVVLAAARWTLHPRALPGRDEATPAERFAAVQEWRSERNVPRAVGLDGPDAPLPLDLDNPLAVDLLLRAAGGGDPVGLVELWPAPDRMAVHGPGGRYAHELIVPMTLARSGADPSPRAAARRPTGRRTFAPGSEWLYAKLYTGRATADAVLTEAIRPVVAAARSAGAATAWHFLRYSDPEFHLRVRFCGDPVRLREEILPAISTATARLFDEGRAWRLQLDTYERELERYGGGDAIALAETVFEADSDAVLELLAAQPPGERAARERWRLAVPSALLLARDVAGDEDRALDVIRRLRDGLITQGDAAPAEQRRALARRLRHEQAELRRLLDQALSGSGGAGEPWREALERRSRRLAPVAAELGRLERQGRLDRSVQEIAGSLVHMHVNRLLRTAGRPQELTVYDAVDRLSAGRAARAARAQLERA